MRAFDTATTLFASVASLALAGQLYAQGSPTAQFQGLGALAGSTEGSRAWDISGDGSVAVGGSPTSATFQEAWRWTSAGNMQGLGFLPGETTSSAHVITADGQFIAGSSGSDAFRWSSGSGFAAIDDGLFGSTVYGISDDGGTIVGFGNDFPVQPLLSAWRWRSGVGIDLTLPGTFVTWTSFADVSADGDTILASSDLFDDSDPYLRTDSGNTYLQFHSPFYCQCGDPAFAMTPDASVVVGQYQWTEAYRWSAGTGREVLLGFLDIDGVNAATRPLGVSDNGSVIVGMATGGSPIQTVAFLWTGKLGMLNVSSILIDNGIDLTGWQLTEAVAVSADGTVILGNGTNPSGDPEAWLAVIPAAARAPNAAPALGHVAFTLLAGLMLLAGVFVLKPDAQSPLEI